MNAVQRAATGIFWCIILVMSLFFLAGFLAGRASAQDMTPLGGGHHANHEWYQNLKSNQGYSCCNGDPEHGDCRPVRARPTPAGWEAFYSGAWHLIPKEAILPDGLNQVPIYAHICERANYVYCFLKGGGGS